MAFVDDIKSIRIQGADNIAIESLKYLMKFSSKNGFGREFDKEMTKLENARPTAVVLYNALEILRKDRRRETIEILLEKLINSKLCIANHGEKLIKNGYMVHTHCHSSEVMAIIKKAAEKKKFSVVADLTMPKKQGIITARELSEVKNIKTILITDSAAGAASTGSCFEKDDIIIVGSDALRKEGAVNKIGTYLLALAARDNKIPFYVAASSFKIDKRKNFMIEERSPDEISAPIKRVEIRNPAFDTTPWNLVSGIITENGIRKPVEFKKHFSK